MRPPPRIVSMSSIASSLTPYSPEIQTRFRAFKESIPDHRLEDKLDRLAEDYLVCPRPSSHRHVTQTQTLTLISHIDFRQGRHRREERFWPTATEL
jgi:hypothetical protein